jgi:AcrR family transcriptional regulator
LRLPDRGDVVNDKIAGTIAAAVAANTGARETGRPYHHGDLRRVLLAAAVEAVAERGPAQVSLRELARRAGVSHAAPAHHFGDKAGLLTAVAEEGYRLLAAELRAAWAETGRFLDVGVAYVRFAIRHRAHFEVMFRPELYRPDEPSLLAARRSAAEMLFGPAGSMRGDDREFDPVLAGVAAWSLVHGLVILWLNGNLPPELGRDPEAIARSVARYLFAPGPDAPRRGRMLRKGFTRR